ncbi:hypothetical protein BDK51DRAFT_41493 [Blyttiomyces helicus]|uniref:Uncharacterized protein n=1 Tax=Blyttiomyces helicus TaxID=388810 RepID=A0A4P9WN45_9FUNG|nr:hypothetical protein BDK51DRAFT_41493 [Blyttiomyces helicus]|eukprot:RKO92176.1 hypothetical protein BDK51DRAFT_41493 [Blyttiomyces helicus]
MPLAQLWLGVQIGLEDLDKGDIFYIVEGAVKLCRIHLGTEEAYGTNKQEQRGLEKVANKVQDFVPEDAFYDPMERNIDRVSIDSSNTTLSSAKKDSQANAALAQAANNEFAQDRNGKCQSAAPSPESGLHDKNDLKEDSYNMYAIDNMDIKFSAVLTRLHGNVLAALDLKQVLIWQADGLLVMIPFNMNKLSTIKFQAGDFTTSKLLVIVNHTRNLLSAVERALWVRAGSAERSMFLAPVLVITRRRSAQSKELGTMNISSSPSSALSTKRKPDGHAAVQYRRQARYQAPEEANARSSCLTLPGPAARSRLSRPDSSNASSSPARANSIIPTEAHDLSNTHTPSFIGLLGPVASSTPRRVASSNQFLNARRSRHTPASGTGRGGRLEVRCAEAARKFEMSEFLSASSEEFDQSRFREFLRIRDEEPLEPCVSDEGGEEVGRGDDLSGQGDGRHGRVGLAAGEDAVEVAVAAQVKMWVGAGNAIEAVTSFSARDPNDAEASDGGLDIGLPELVDHFQVGFRPKLEHGKLRASAKDRKGFERPIKRNARMSHIKRAASENGARRISLRGPELRYVCKAGSSEERQPPRPTRSILKAHDRGLAVARTFFIVIVHELAIDTLDQAALPQHFAGRETPEAADEGGSLERPLALPFDEPACRAQHAAEYLKNAQRMAGAREAFGRRLGDNGRGGDF